MGSLFFLDSGCQQDLNQSETVFYVSSRICFCQYRRQVHVVKPWVTFGCRNLKNSFLSVKSSPESILAQKMDSIVKTHLFFKHSVRGEPLFSDIG